MSPNDPLFSEPAPEPTPGGEGDTTPTPAASVGLTPEQFNEGIEQVVGGLREQVEGLSQAVSQMSQSANPAPEPASTEPEGDFLTRFSQDPEGAIKSLVGGEMKGLAPFLNTMIEGGSSAFMDIEAQRVDNEFGKGAWEKLYAKPMGEIVGMYQKQNPTALGDRNVLRREVDMLTGRMVGEVVKYQQESRDAVEKEGLERLGTVQENILKEAANRTGLVGGLRRTPTGEQEVTEDLKGYLAERESAIGLEQDPKDFLKQTDYGNTLEDYIAHQEKLGGGSN